MNYKLVKHFIEIKEKSGVIENNSSGYIEFAIVNDINDLSEYSDSNKVIEPSGKFKYSLEDGQKIFGRALNRITSMINVFPFESNISSEFDPSEYYTKSQADDKFAQKNGNINTATKLQNSRTISLVGGATGSVEFDGSQNVEMNVTISSESVGVPTSTQVIAGNGLSGGGALSGDITLNITSEDDGIIVNSDAIKLNIADDMNTDSSTRPSSAKQVKLLNEGKLGKNEKAQSATISDSCSGNSATATKLETIRNINITGSVTGTAQFDGSGDVNLSTELSNLDGSKISTLNGYSKASEISAIQEGDTLLSALGKLEKAVESVPSSAMYQNLGKQFSLYYCTKLEYESLEKIQDDSTIYLILDEESGNIELKVYRP